MKKLSCILIGLFIISSWSLTGQNQWENSSISTRTTGSVAIGDGASLMNKRKLNIWSNDGSGNERTGIFNYLNSSGGTSGISKYGIYNQVTNSGNATKYGIYNEVGGNNSDTYGLYSKIDGGTNNYSIYTTVNGSGNYALYAESESNNSKSAFFKGNAEFHRSDIEITNNISNSNFAIRNQWQNDGNHWLKFMPIVNGISESDRSLELNETGELKKYVEAGEDIAFTVRTGGEINFLVLGNGQTCARGIKVDVGIFPDYVFEKTYELMPLKELETYINQHKHLPNIPAGKQIETEGMDLGDITVKQMEKIEELTLYIIELNKQMEELKKEMSELRK